MSQKKKASKKRGAPHVPLASESGGGGSSAPTSPSSLSSARTSPAATTTRSVGVYQRSLRLMWASQFLSLLGTEVSKFALRTWSYESAGAVTDFAWLVFLSELPAILLSPLTGPVVDRCNRKLLMIGSDLTAGLATLTLFFLWQRGAMELSHIYCAVTLQAVCNSIQLPAFMASLSLLIADQRQDLVKLNSVNQALSGVAMLLAPTIGAGLLKTKPGLSLVFGFDLTTLVMALLVMFWTRIPAIPSQKMPLSAAERQDSNGSSSGRGVGKRQKAGQQQRGHQQQQKTALQILSKLWRDNVDAWRFLQSHPGLLALLLVVAQIQLSNGAFQILATPIILSFAEPSAIAGVMTMSGIGAMAGFALPMALKGANTFRALTVLGCVFLQGLLLLLLAVPTLEVLLGVAFFYMGLVPLSRSCREAIWMEKVESSMQGRVFSLQYSLSKVALPLAAVLSGPLIDRVLQPLVDGNPTVAALAGSDGTPRGRSGRGSALMALILGAGNVAVAVAAFVYRPFRALDGTPAAEQHNE